jgi:hypothetical protein
LPSLKDFDKGSPNGGLGGLLKRFGFSDRIKDALKNVKLPLPAMLKNIAGAERIIKDIVGPEMLYKLNLEPLLMDKTKMSKKLRLNNKWCMFTPGMIPFLPRDAASKFGPHLVLPQIPTLPRVIHTGVGDFKILKTGILIPDIESYNFGSLNAMAKIMKPMLEKECPKRVCGIKTFRKYLQDFTPGFHFKARTNDFKDLLDEYLIYFMEKAGMMMITPGGNLPLPPPLNLLWGTAALNTPGTKDCTLSVFPMQNTGEYAYDDPTLVKQYCEIANTVWCHGDSEKCKRQGGSIYAHSSGALTLLEGIKQGICIQDMKINIIGAPFKGLKIAESLKKYDTWCSKNSKGKYFDSFFNDIRNSGAQGNCGPQIDDYVKKFGTSMNSLTKSMYHNFKMLKPTVLEKVQKVALIEAEETQSKDSSAMLHGIQSLSDDEEKMHMYTQLYHIGKNENEVSNEDHEHAMNYMQNLSPSEKTEFVEELSKHLKNQLTTTK